MSQRFTRSETIAVVSSYPSKPDVLYDFIFPNLEEFEVNKSGVSSRVNDEYNIKHQVNFKVDLEDKWKLSSIIIRGKQKLLAFSNEKNDDKFVCGSVVSRDPEFSNSELISNANSKRYPFIELIESRRLWLALNEVRDLSQKDTPVYELVFKPYLTSHTFDDKIPRTLRVDHAKAFNQLFFPSRSKRAKNTGNLDDPNFREEDEDKDFGNLMNRYVNPSSKIQNSIMGERTYPERKFRGILENKEKGTLEIKEFKLSILQRNGMRSMFDIEEGSTVKDAPLDLTDFFERIVYDSRKIHFISKDGITVKRLENLKFDKITGRFVHDTTDGIVTERFGVRSGFMKFNPGTGKTLMMCALIQETLYRKDDLFESNFQDLGLNYVEATLIIVPNLVTEKWLNDIKAACCFKAVDFRNELKKWGVTSGQTSWTNRHFEIIDEIVRKNDAIIISHNMIPKYIDRIFKRYVFRRIVIDECHAMKNEHSKLSVSVFKLHAKYKWPTSATPLPNRIRELFSYMKFLQIPFLDDPLVWANKDFKLNTRIQTSVFQTLFIASPDIKIDKSFTYDLNFTDEEMEQYKELKYEANLLKVIGKSNKKVDFGKDVEIAQKMETLLSQKVNLKYWDKALIGSLSPMCATILKNKNPSEDDLKRAIYKSVNNESTKLKEIKKILETIYSTEETKNDNIIITASYHTNIWIIYNYLIVWGYQNIISFSSNILKKPMAINKFKRNEFNNKLRAAKDNPLDKMHGRQIILSTMKVIKEGIDMDYANHIIIVDPTWNRDEHKQLICRIERGGWSGTDQSKKLKKTHEYNLYIKGIMEEGAIILQDDKTKIKGNLGLTE